MSEIKLSPCPFCDGEAELLYTETYSAHTLFWVACKDCDCRTDDFEDIPGKEKAIKAWNTRKPMERIVERLEERLEEQYRLYSIAFLPEDRGGYDAYADAIKIVKEAGGADDQ